MIKNVWHTRILASLALVLFGATAMSFWSAQNVYAQSGGVASTQAAAGAAVGACPGLAPCPPWGTFLSLQTTNKEMLQPTLGVVLTGMLGNALTFVSDRLAYDSAMYLATGDKGQSPLFYADSPTETWKNFGLDSLGDTLGLLNDLYLPASGGGQFKSGTGDSLGSEAATAFLSRFNLCAPPNPAVTLAISLSVKSNYARPKPRCEWANVSRNWESAWENIVSVNKNPTEAAMKALAESLRPGKNEISIAVGTNIKIADEITQKRAIEYANALANNGVKPVTDYVTGQVKTPASFVYASSVKTITDKDGKKTDVLVGQLNNPSLSSFGAAYASHIASTFVNTALGGGVLQRLYNGLFTPTAPQDTLGSLFAPSSSTTVSPALSSVNAITPINISNYDVLSEFTVCPNGAINRGINNCVIDAQFFTAISRGSSGSPLTVREAIAQNYLNGDWPLISSNEPARNQDPLCYSQGYCYGNLVKLRRARIVSVGWEMAAQLSRPEKPYTLKVVMDAFNDCKNNPTICHLIDPDWVLKYPLAQCRAQVNGEILASPSGATRNTYCADVQDCVSERPDGSCASYGYCVREKNAWKFKGDACPAQYASCLTFTDTSTSKTASFLLNTVDYGTCTQQNAGCLWYAASQVADTKGTASKADDIFAWADTDANKLPLPRAYFNGTVQQCSPTDEGCSKLVVASGAALNMITNPGFESEENGDGMPDGWAWTGTTPGVYDHASAGHAGGTVKSSVAPSAGIVQTGIALAPSVTYTLSGYVRGSQTAGSGLTIVFKKEDGSAANITGLAVSGGCTASGNSLQRSFGEVVAYDRFSCTFSSPTESTFADITLAGSSYRFDDIQLEAGSRATVFIDGYNPSNAPTALVKVAPSYLGCTGADTDPAACSAYAGSCQAQDIGCMLYAPASGEPSIPATTSKADSCPNECVGYASFKQEATPSGSDPVDFPVNFIPAKAKACDAQYVGCDAFTNLNKVATGGEGIEYYTSLRACSTVADAGAASATYFTWEGSDQAGYQLRTWQLYKSNQNAAPCTTWKVVDLNGATGAGAVVRPGIQCVDAGTATEASCDAHEDIFTNPDCREFYDQDGAITYRAFSKTVSVSDACTPYRKTSSTLATCTAARGLWIGSGECRYLSLAEGSLSCPATANGCRAYTGGSGNNLQTVYTENFDTVAGFTAPAAYPTGATGVVIGQSLESIAPGGRSLSVQVDANNKGFLATVFKASISAGHAYTVSFWAKGTMPVDVGFLEKGTTATPGALDALGVNVPLDTTWRQFTFGPFDAPTSFDQTAALVFTSRDAGSFFLDNIVVKQSGTAITVLKNSWSTPASCDVAPGPYLGCQAYTDQKGTTSSLYQFTRLCSEKVVGCQAFYDTRNSTAVGGKISNLRCVKIAGAVAGGTDCQIGTVKYCTIAPGHDTCFFDVAGSTKPNPDTGNGFRIDVGVEARVVPNDGVTYLVDDGKGSCTAGCRAFGKPVYNQDRSAITSYQSVYLLDQPDNYKNALCTDEALFCKAWNTTNNGAYFFKDPGDKTCEYKTNVRVDGGDTYDGWFKTGSNKPCYADNVVGGRQYGIWRNGDTDKYDGWVGTCKAEANRCTEFVDPTDVTLSSSGHPYDFVNNDTLKDASTKGTGACVNDQVSRKFGCALFRDGTINALASAAGPTYVLSTHADVLTNNGQADALVDPIDCRQPDAGKKTYKKPDNSTETVDLCARRCQYDVPAHESLVDNRTPDFDASKAHAYLDSCLLDTDCQGVRMTDGIVHPGVCVNVAAADLRVKNDANRTLKVTRDRACGEWLTCSSTRSSWNSASAKYDQICDKIDLCVASVADGSTSQCGSFSSSAPNILSAAQYQKRNVSWTGEEYAGYSIPNQLPVDLYRDVNIADSAVTSISTLGYIAGSCTSPKVCKGGANDGKSCVNNSSCGGGGTCVEKSGSACRVGICEETGSSCSADADCGLRASGGRASCLIGFCQKQVSPKGICTNDANKTCAANIDCGIGGSCTSRNFCFSDADCAGYSQTKPYTCDMQIHVCVDVAVTDTSRTSCSSDTSCGSGTTCRYYEGAKAGGCYSGLCLTSVQDTHNLGVPDVIDLNDPAFIEKTCRAYPEDDAPFPARIVKAWKGTSGINRDASLRSIIVGTLEDVALSFVMGYDQAHVYAPATKENGKGNTVVAAYDGPACSYEKVQYGNGAAIKYYPEGQARAGSICVGGPDDGKTCGGEGNGDVCDATKGGSCVPVTEKESHIGWQGYCLERDTSIQLYGSQRAEDRPCLTWLPVDQLYSATDVYGKFVTAGWEPQNTYYCAEKSIYYDIHPSAVACAETKDKKGSSTPSVSSELWWSGADCWKSVVCPPNEFAVLAAADTDASTDVAHGQDCTEGDNDCAYFCVPNLAFKPSGEACVPPQVVGHSVADETGKILGPAGAVSAHQLNADSPTQMVDTNSQYLLDSLFANTTDGRKAAGYDTSIYLASEKDDTFSKLGAYYTDCTTKGVPTPSATNADYAPGRMPFKNLQNYGLASQTGFYNYVSDQTVYLGCRTLAKVATDQVGSSTTDGSPGLAKLSDALGIKFFNQAWTDRVWQQKTKAGTERYTLQSTTTGANFSTSTPKFAFGMANDALLFQAAQKDPRPQVPAMCVKMVQVGTEKKPTGDLFPANAAGNCSDVPNAELIFTNPQEAFALYSSRLTCQQTVADPPKPSCQLFVPLECDGTFSANKDFDFTCQGIVKESTKISFEYIPERPQPTYLGAPPPCGNTSAPIGTSGDVTVRSAIGTPFCTISLIGGVLSQNCTQTSSSLCATIDPDGAGGQPPKQFCNSNPTADDNNLACGTHYVKSGTTVSETYESFVQLPKDGETINDAVGRLKQIFGSAVDILQWQPWCFNESGVALCESKWPFEDDSKTVWETYFKNKKTNADFLGGYVGTKNSIFPESKTSSLPTFQALDATKNGDGLSTKPKAPIIRPVGDCRDGICLEGEMNKAKITNPSAYDNMFTVDGVISGQLTGQLTKHIVASFFAFADKNQMPLRRMVIDWGDSRSVESVLPNDAPLDLTTRSGSAANNNFYKNHRGRDGEGNQICGTQQTKELPGIPTDDLESFGTSSNACDTSYVAFTHDYVCSGAIRDLLTKRTCHFEAGKLTNSPCVSDGGVIPNSAGKCVFQPRINITDNWGWCSGVCNGGPDNTSACYAEECEINQCPTSTPGDRNCPAAIGGKTDNPWVNFGGYIVVSPPGVK